MKTHKINSFILVCNQCGGQMRPLEGFPIPKTCVEWQKQFHGGKLPPIPKKRPNETYMEKRRRISITKQNRCKGKLHIGARLTGTLTYDPNIEVDTELLDLGELPRKRD